MGKWAKSLIIKSYKLRITEIESELLKSKTND